MSEMETLIQKYWSVVSKTRQSGRISENVKAKEREYWDAFPEELVKEALTIHIQKYPNMRENYTRGILRNLKRTYDAQGKLPVKKPGFHNFQQREYDYDALEKELLGLD